MKSELAQFSYTPDEWTLIKTALRAAKPWEAEGLDDIKRRIKDFHRELSQNICCYCQRDLNAEFQMVIDVEHILPSSIFSDLTFEIWNLSAACKRCNMRIKQNDVDFIDVTESNFFSARHYKFIHPNFDEIEENLLRCSVQKGRNRLVKYLIISGKKGKYAYDYFRLYEFEMGAFDEAQGANLTDESDPVHRAAYELMRTRVNNLQALEEE